MELSRRTFCLGACAFAMTGIGAVASVHGQGSHYPSRPIRFIVPFAAGGESDITARIIASNLARLKGYSVIVDNVPGAGGNLGVAKALREPADGYTFIVISGAYLANAVASGQPQDPVVAIQPVIQFTSQPAVLVGNQKYSSLQQLIDTAKKAPGSLNYGSAGIGSLGNFSCEEFSRLAGIKMTHVPYKGNSQAINDLAMGQVDMMSAGVSGALTMVGTGKVRILGTATTKRIPEMPEVPTLSESGVAYVSSLWHGLIAAKEVPAAIIAKMNVDLALVLRDPETVAALKPQMLTPVGGSPEDFKKTMARDVAKLKAIAAASHIRTQQQ